MTFPIVYAVKHKDEATRAASRSGGIFTALSDYFLMQNGVVYGCVLDENFNAVHSRAVSAQERNLMRGSKYIQSNIGETFNQVKLDLQNNKPVLFSGTSCQIAGLKSFLQDKYENIFYVDIVCHGVPSNRVWHDYLKYQEKNQNSKCVAVDFRNKAKFGWNSHMETLDFQNGNSIDSDVFKTLFYEHKILRPSCYVCPYKDIIHPGDITIADYWGIDNACPGFNDNKGVSLVLLNNEFGLDMFKNVCKDIVYELCDINKSMQPPLAAPFPCPPERDKLWKDYNAKSFSYIVKKYCSISFAKRLKNKLIKISKRMFTR